MEGFGIEKLALILVIVLVLFGARRIPEIGGSIGKGIREFKRGMSDLDKDDDTSRRDDRIAAAPVAARDAAEPNWEPRRLHAD